MNYLIKNNDVEDAWTGLSTESIRDFNIENPLLEQHPPDKLFEENPGLYEFAMLSDPKYIGYAAWLFLGINLFPFQLAILHNLWKHSFPMFIASRGAGKTFLLAVYALLRCLLIPHYKIVFASASFRQSKNIIQKAIDIWDNSPMFRSMCYKPNDVISKPVEHWIMKINSSSIKALPIGSGCLSANTYITSDRGITTINHLSKNVWGNNKFRHIKYNIDNGFKPTKIVTTHNGYSYEGTYNHAMKVVRNNEIVWVRTDQIKIGDRILIDRTKRWHSNYNDISTDEAYALGLMVSDGCWTGKYRLCFATKDPELAEYLNRGFPTEFKQCKNDKIHYVLDGKQIKEDWLNRHSMKVCYGVDKYIPDSILNGSKENMAAFISGLFDGDGHLQVVTEKGGVGISIGFTNISKKLVNQLQYVLLHYGIISTLRFRDREHANYRIYELAIYGKDVRLFADQINFKLKRKRSILNNAIKNKTRWTSNRDSVPVTKDVVLESCAGYKRPSKYRNSRIRDLKSLQIDFLLGLIKIIGSTSWSHLVNPNIYYDTVISIENSQCNTYDIHVPENNEYCANGFFSHNSTIRGERANCLIIDEFNSMGTTAHSQGDTNNIVEVVLSGFLSVQSDSAENVRRMAREKALEDLGIDKSLFSEQPRYENQFIVSGTAGYFFEPLYSYWKKYKTIIESKGDPKVLEKAGIPTDESLNYKDYCIIRLPREVIPKGLFAEKAIARSKSQMTEQSYSQEYDAVFTKDSSGFFKKSLIHSCEANQLNIDNGNIPSIICNTPFDAKSLGNEHRIYAYGIDPAFKQDNFAIAICELYKDHSRLIYCWTTNEKDYFDRKRHNMTNEDNYYSFCCRHLRNLIESFTPWRIAIDAQGGGNALMETLRSKSLLASDEKPLLPIKEKNKAKETDRMDGHHILVPIQFVNANWTSDANHTLLGDMEKKRLIFPQFDVVTSELSITEDKIRANRIAKDFGISAEDVHLYDSLEDIVYEIEQLKDELATITYYKTSSGITAREKWDVPDVMVDGRTKTSGKKDRYCALLMANYLAKLYRQGEEMDKPRYALGASVKEGAQKNFERRGGYMGNTGYENVFDRFGLVK